MCIRDRSSDESAADVRPHSAVHVLQGAVTQVLGPSRFTSAQIGRDRSGILKARSGRIPGAQDVSRIEAAANEKIAEDAEVLEFRMDRDEAEGHFGIGIYDLCPAPEGEEPLKMVRIPEWDASCCARVHVDSTGPIGTLRIDGSTFDQAGKEFELRFHVL